MHQLDDSFKQAKQARAERRRRILIRRMIVAGSLFVLVGAGALTALLMPQLWQGFLGGGGPSEGTQTAEDSGAAPAVYIPAIVDLAGDPMKISLGDDGGQVTRFVPRPPVVEAARVSIDVAVLSDVMITTSQRFMTTLPSSPQDFALYQSQRSTSPAPQFDPEPDQFEGPGASAGSGSLLGVESASASEPPAPVVEDTTSVALVRPESRRFKPESEYVIKIKADQTLDSLMTENRLAPEDASVFSEALTRLLERPGLLAGDVVAIHGINPGNDTPYLRPVQVSLYNGGAYLGTLTRADSGEVVLGADPWVYDSLFNYSGQDEVAQPGRQYRLLDAIYSTAARNRVPTGVLGEAIMLLSRSFDLNAFATSSDRLVLAYARDGRGDEGGTGRILYVAVQGTDRSMQCYVFRMPGADGDYSCFTQGRGGQSVATPAGMITPVRGVLTTPFGPAMDPLLKKVTVHTGVDWSAPAGTPVVAAFAGTVAAAGQSGDEGNLLRLKHPDGRETTYSHLQGFATGMSAGRNVRAGELIGYVGTSGRTAGPTLHFEMLVAGTPVDPLAATTSISSDDNAVEVLTDRIIHVESGGNATAQNPLSSAFGAGQFIKSTWIRMMKTYRPDLAGSMPEDQLLALRADPTIAREMVQNLAREGESYLRSRGHSITPGRLYLCHFLGMEDANVVLSADPAAMLDTVVGAGVISANPFLTPMTVADVVDWAERKMSGKRAPPPPPVPPEFRIYQAAIDGMLTPGAAQTASIQ